MPKQHIALELLDDGSLRDRLVTFAVIQETNAKLADMAVDKPLRLDDEYLRWLRDINFSVDFTGETISGWLEAVEFKSETGLNISANIYGTVARLEAAGIDFSKFDFRIKVEDARAKLLYTFDWYEASEPCKGYLKLTSIEQ